MVPRLGSLKKENKKLLISQFAELRNVGVASLSDSVSWSLLRLQSGCQFGLESSADLVQWSSTPGITHVLILGWLSARDLGSHIVRWGSL